VTDVWTAKETKSQFGERSNGVVKIGNTLYYGGGMEHDGTAMRRSITRSGHTTDERCGGAPSSVYDALVTDVAMPRMPGTELAARI